MSAISPTFSEVLEKYHQSPHKKTGTILHFDGIGDKDIYNPTVIDQHGKVYIAARVESRNSDWMNPNQYDPCVMFFEKQQFGPWIVVKDAPTFMPMEDPFATWIHDEDGNRKLIFGGVIILDRTPEIPIIGTAFYKGDDIFSLEKEPFAVVQNMKDIRIVERIHKKEIIVCTRPNVAGWQTGRIGIIKIKSIHELASEEIWNACVDFNQVAQGTWLGANKLYLINQPHSKKERIGVLGHIATAEEHGKLHYAAMSFTFDPNDPCDQDLPEAIPRVIVTRSDFQDGSTKSENLVDVVFPAGLEHLENGLVKLYAGLSDARIGTILIPDPFLKHR